jgi:hypothetical protein
VTKEAGQLPLTEHSKEIETDVVGSLMIIKRGLGVIIIIIYIYIIHKSSQESIHQSTSQNIISIIGETLMLNYFRYFFKINLHFMDILWMVAKSCTTKRMVETL